MRLIDADELKIYISTTFCDTCKRDKGVCSSCAFDDVFVAIDNAPTIDAVKVVRCKDCKYLERNYCDEYGDLEPLFCKNWVAGVDEDGYCYEAERREP